MENLFTASFINAAMVRMGFDNRRLAGALLWLGTAQFILGMVLAEAIYPGYSVSRNFISDLGVGPAAAIFNSSVILLGVAVIASTYFLHLTFRRLRITILFGLAGLGALGVGVFPESFGFIHTAMSLAAFLFGGLSAIAAYNVEKKPLSYFSLFMGGMSLSALIFFSMQQSLGLGRGGMERMIAYPILLWALGFGGYLMGSSEKWQ